MVLVFNDSWAILREIIQEYSSVNDYVQTAVTGFLQKELDALDSLKGGSIDRERATQALASTRTNISNYLGSSADLLLPALLLIGESIGSPSTDPVQIMLDLRKYFDDNGETVSARNFTYGAQTPVGVPTGDGLIARTTDDEFGFPIERLHADVVTLECVRDQTVGATDPGKEIFRVHGRRTAPDELEIDNTDRGSGLDEEIAGQEAIDSIVPNASFSNADNDLAPITLTGWKWDDGGVLNPTFLGNGTDIQIDRVEYYRRSKQLEGNNPGSLQMHKAIRLVAEIGADGRGGLDERFPYFGGIAINPTPGSYVGDFRARIGGMLVSVTPAPGWTLLLFSRINGDNWPVNFNEVPPDTFFEVETFNYVSGYLNVDHFLCFPQPSYDGHFLSLVGRAIDWKKRDKYTLTDTHSATPGQINTTLWRATGIDLLSTTGVPTRPD